MLPPANYIKPEMIFIHGGTFQMGSENGMENEKPVHSVTVDNFYIGKYPVTNKEYKLFNPDHKGRWSDPDYPVECVTWYDTIEYCKWLSDSEGFSLCYSGSGDNIVCDFTKNGYRLPTEAEWEYACRAGTTTAYYWGDEYDYDGDYCWYWDNSMETVNFVGKKKPNQFGLYDMSGNVWEWCNDWHGSDYYKHCVDNNVLYNPIGPLRGSFRVLRGGSWNDFSVHCESAYRRVDSPGCRSSNFAFRLVRSAP